MPAPGSRPFWAALCGLAALLAPPRAAPARADLPEADPPHAYVLEAELDPATHEVAGAARIRWRNTSREPARELYFHLYPNAFAHDRTVFMRETGGRLRGVRARGRGSIDVTALRIADGPDLLPDARTDLIKDDATQMRVPLPEPVPPGGELELRARFRTRLPPLFARSGYVGDYHAVAQWFPKLARREPDGTWATFPYHGNGEFYADFATYDLTVRLPVGHVVAATGERVSDRSADGRRELRFVARWVHDAAFVTWPHFRERRESMGTVRVRIVHPPGYGPAVDRHVAITRAGLRRFGQLYGEYPYPVLTVVVPPRGTEGGAGMEYPTLFITWGPWFAVPGVRGGLHEDVTAHELAHQWFQGMVATHEERWPMLDEGLSNWASWDLLGAVFGRSASAVGSPWPAVDGFELLRLFAFRGPPTPAPAQPAHAFGSATYGRAIYGRVPVLLETIARTWGRERMHRALGTFARRHRFGHPGPAELYRAFDGTYGAGFADRVLRPALEEGHHAAVAVARARSRPIAAGHRTHLVARRGGRVPIPTRLDFVGTRQPGAHLSARESQVTLVHRGPEPVGGEVDRGRRILLDPDELDDARAPEARERPLGGLASRALLLAQAVLGWVGP